jgi:hypothetical protein
MNPEMKRDPAGIVRDVPSLGQPRSRVQPIVAVDESVVDEAEVSMPANAMDTCGARLCPESWPK